MPHAKGFIGVLSLMLLLGMLISPDFPADAFGGGPATAPSLLKASGSLNDILQYISSGWDQLTRSLNRCETFQDIKVPGGAILYMPAEMSIPPGMQGPRKQCDVRMEHLPAKITSFGSLDPGKISHPGLLYLEHPYVVPGGQFNEMYGWDSYFIIRGLLENHRRDLAKGMVENFLFEVQHYGGMLNANRTYYLTRSQPPFLSSMILAVYRAEEAAGQADRHWLETAYRLAAVDYDRWVRQPHLAGDTGLARYFDLGDGPVPEIEGDPMEYYREVARYFLLHGGANNSYLTHVSGPRPPVSVAGPVFSVFVCGQQETPANCAAPEHVALTADFYKGDRSMRESGFDETFRFGPFGADTHHYAPVCLNSLLYKTEKDLEEISAVLGKQDDAKQWGTKATERQQRIAKYLWDDQRGLFFDYNFSTAMRSTYEYATTFYPLWAGLASKEEAAAVERNIRLFEQPGGLAMSRNESEEQWDLPYGWAPIHLLAVEGLRSYGYAEDADRIAYKFLRTVLQNFERDRTLREKYNVVTGSAETHIETGYKENVIGFGWSNGVFLVLLSQTPPGLVSRLSAESAPRK